MIAGCTMDNPGFGLSQTGGETTGLETSAGPSTATDDPSTATQTSDPTGEQTSEASGTTDSTSTIDPTTTTTETTDASDSESDSETDSDSEADTNESETDDMGELIEVILPATQALCVLLTNGAPHAGPEQCEQIVSFPKLFEPQGIIANDTALVAGGLGLNREAQMFVKLDWPPELTDKEILTLKLELNVQGDADSAGDLWLSQPFTKQSLGDGPADPIMELLPSAGPIEAGEVRFFELDPEVWTAGEPLHLVFVPDSSDGSFYWSSLAEDPELRPSFHISYH